MRVKVEYLGHIKKLTNNTRHEEIDVKSPAAVTDVLMILTEKYGEPFKKAIYEPKGADVKSNYIITVNGYLLNQLKGLETKLKPEDRIAIMPVVSGG